MNHKTATGATLYFRHNGSFGAQCDGARDTGHHIAEDSGRFSVWSIHNEERQICTAATRAQAEAAIALDWRNKAEGGAT